MKHYCIQHGYAWADSIAHTSGGEQEYYEELLEYYKKNERVSCVLRSSGCPAHGTLCETVVVSLSLGTLRLSDLESDGVSLLLGHPFQQPQRGESL